MYRAEEDYLKNIYELTIEQGKTQIKSNELAESLGLTDQSTNDKIKKLMAKEYVVFKRYQGISLTKRGEREAIRLIRAHRLWEVFLFQHLKFEWSHLHAVAEELEHASNTELIEKLYEFLGKPKFCQHGNPIPNLSGEVENVTTTTLLSCNIDDVVTIKRVLDRKDLLLYCDEINLTLETKLKIVEKNDFAQFLVVNKDDDRLVITYTIANMIFVKSDA